ncbi:MAG: STAS domain-containing protein [Acidimicrobiales bacterium]
MNELLQMASVERDGSVVWDVEGEIDLASAPAFERQVSDSGAEGRAVVVDLGRVRYLDSAGLASLVRLHLQLDQRGSKLKVVVADGSVARSTITLAALDQVIAVFASLDGALAA